MGLSTGTGTDLKTFVGSKDFETSRDFYVAIGWPSCSWITPSFSYSGTTRRPGAITRRCT